LSMKTPRAARSSGVRRPASVSLAGAAYNLLWVTIGNVIGGAVFVAGGDLAASPSAERKVLAEAPAE